MKLEVIEYGNKLIMEYLGIELDPVPEYHCSYELLMPVVIAITETTDFEFFSQSCNEPVKLDDKLTIIENIWIRTIDFISWIKLLNTKN